MHQHRRDRRIHPARDRANRMPRADPLPNLRRGLRDKVLCRPVGDGPANAQHKVAQQLGSLPRVLHLRVKLHRPDALCRVCDPGQRVCRARGLVVPGWQLQRLVPMRHPHPHGRRQPGEQWRVPVHQCHLGIAILAPRRRLHPAAAVMHNKLQTVANPQHRHPHGQHPRVSVRRVRVIDRRGAARQHNPARLQGLYLGKRCRTRQHC